MFVEHHVVASYNFLSLQIINHFSFIFMLTLQSQLNEIVLQAIWSIFMITFTMDFKQF